MPSPLLNQQSNLVFGECMQGSLISNAFFQFQNLEAGFFGMIYRKAEEQAQVMYGGDRITNWTGSFFQIYS